MEWIIQLVLGAIGGNVGGALFKKLSLGVVGNSIAGIVGGGIGGHLLNAIMGTGAEGSVVADIAGGGIGGIIIMAIVGWVKNTMTRK